MCLNRTLIKINEYLNYSFVNSYYITVYCTHRRSVIKANEAVAYPVFGRAVELSG